MSNLHDIGVAVAGAGFIGPVHVEALKRVGVRVVGILGCDLAESKSARDALSLEKAYKDFDEVLADDAVHAVHLAVPNVLHYDMAKKALAAGKHVMCEKPLAMTSEQSGELVKLAEKSPCAAAVNYNIRFYPLCLEAAHRVRGGELGDVYHVCGSYVQDWLHQPTDYNWRVLADQGGALRAVSDIGTHWLDLVHAVTGLEAESLCADLWTVFPTRHRPKGEVETFKAKEEKAIETEPVEITTEDYGAILIRFKGGARGTLWVSQVTAGRKNCLRYELAGSKAALAWESESPNQLWIGQRDVANGLLLRDPALVSDPVRPSVAFPGGHNEGFPDTFKQCFRTFYEHIAAGNGPNPPYPTFADGHREIVLCEAILKSQRQGGWVTI